MMENRSTYHMRLKCTHRECGTQPQHTQQYSIESTRQNDRLIPYPTLSTLTLPTPHATTHTHARSCSLARVNNFQTNGGWERCEWSCFWPNKKKAKPKYTCIFICKLIACMPDTQHWENCTDTNTLARIEHKRTPKRSD